MDIEIRYFDDCPNWQDTTQLVRRLVNDEGIDADLSLREVATQEEAEALRFLGSPTILVDGEDPFAVEDAPIGLSCRIYMTEDGMAGSPSETQLRAVLDAGRG